MRTISIIFLFISMSFCYMTSAGDIPPTVEQAFQKKYPKENSPEWERDDHGYYEAHFKKNDKKYRADFTAEGQWIETETNVDFDELPKLVRKVVEDEFDEDDITEIELVEHYQKGFFYDVEFKRKGKNKDVEISPMGAILN